MANSTGGPAKPTLTPEGMENRSPSASDASTKCTGGSVDSEPTRSSVAPTPATLGGRTA